MKYFLSILFIALILATACKNRSDVFHDSGNAIIASGKMPGVAIDNSKTIHVVYGKSDSLLYSYSSDQGKTFSDPSLISVLPKLMARAMRGPQVVATTDGLSVTACNTSGDIFSFVKNVSGNWFQTARVNDVDTVAKENLMALSGDGQIVFAVWLDLRSKHNQIFGSQSTDGGKTWSKNILIYASPDTTVCECCKPSVQVKGKDVYVMFRNWLQGNRDLYLIHSSDGGLHFEQAKKLGNGSWTLNGCPMDGGALVLDQHGNPRTVWNRKGTIYACNPGMEEQKVGEGKSCTLELIHGENAYAWVNKGNVIVQSPGGAQKDLDKGELPIIKRINDDQIICVWQHDNQIHKTILSL